MNERAALGERGPGPLLHVCDGGTFWIGTNGYLGSHQGGAAVHLVGLYGKFRIRIRGGGWLLCQAAILQPGEWRELHFGGEPFAALYIEPNIGAFGAPFIPHSASKRQTSLMILLVFLFAFASFASLCAGASAQPAQQNQCFSTAETRDKIAAHGLSEPLRSIQKAATHFQAEALAAKLCRRDDAFVYEISLLRRDGKIVRGLYDAKTGQIIEPKAAK